MNKKSLRNVSALMSFVFICMLFIPAFIKSSMTNNFATAIPGIALAFALIGGSLTEGLCALYKDTLEEDAPIVRVLSLIGFLIVTVYLIFFDPFGETALTVRGAVLLFIFLVASFSRIAAEAISAQEIIIANRAARRLRKQEA